MRSFFVPCTFIRGISRQGSQIEAVKKVTRAFNNALHDSTRLFNTASPHTCVRAYQSLWLVATRSNANWMENITIGACALSYHACRISRPGERTTLMTVGRQSLSGVRGGCTRLLFLAEDETRTRVGNASITCMERA